MSATAATIVPTIPNSALTLKGVVRAERFSLPFRTASELTRTEPAKPIWFVPGFIGAGIILELAGKLKASGKTTFTSHLLKAILSGSDFLGRSTRQVTGVVYLTEERAATFCQTLQRADLDYEDSLWVLHWHDVRELGWADLIARAVDHCRQVGAQVLVVDTVGQFAGLSGDAENNSGDAIKAVAPLQVAAAQGLGVIVLRHERKGGGEVGESGRGSSAFSAAMDIIVALRRPEGQTRPTARVLHTLSRFSETPETLVIELRDGRYVALGTSGSVAVMEAEQALLERLPTSEASAVAISNDLLSGDPRIARTVAQRALKRLIEASLVTQVGTGKKKDPHRYYRTDEVSAQTQIPNRAEI